MTREVETMETRRYPVLYADPPYRYDMRRGRGVAENHYRTMGIDGICALPVEAIAERDCALFLWATFPMLPEALRVIRAWGFEYKTVAFLWVKTYRRSATWFYGMGFWTRSNAEVCLLAIRGHPRRVHKGIHQLVVAPVEAHSRKPDEVRERIVALMGDVPRIELFARQRTQGWDTWGDEVECDIILAHTEGGDAPCQGGRTGG